MDDTLAIVNIGVIVSGELDRPLLKGDAIFVEDGRIAEIGRRSDIPVDRAQVVVDAQGTVVTPGLIDSHVHVVLGDYTPRQKTVDFIDSYMHGGITTMISAGEIHAPGRPRDRAGVKALAIAAARCFSNFRPSGVKVHAGAVILEPTLLEEDFAEMAAAGVWLAKLGFGDYKHPVDAEPQVRWAKKHGMVVMAHTGGASLPGCAPITAEYLKALGVDIAGHANGGTTALTDAGMETLLNETDIIVQVVQAGNLRAALKLVRMASELQLLSRVVVASDTPTGTGMIPLAVIKSVTELSSLVPLKAETALALATGNVARAWGLSQVGTVKVGNQADLVIMDAPWGSAAGDALQAIEIGDIPGITAVIIDGKLRALRSRNTPAATRFASLIKGQF